MQIRRHLFLRNQDSRERQVRHAIMEENHQYQHLFLHVAVAVEETADI